MNKNKVVLSLIGLFIGSLTIYGSYLICKDIAYDNGSFSIWIRLYLIIALGISLMLYLWNLAIKNKRISKKQSMLILLITPLITLTFSAAIIIINTDYFRVGLFLTIFIALLVLFKNSKYSTTYALVGTLSAITLFGWFIFGVKILVDPKRIITQEALEGYLFSLLLFIPYIILWLRHFKMKGLKTLLGLVILVPLYIFIGLIVGKHLFLILFVALFMLQLKNQDKKTVAHQI